MQILEARLTSNPRQVTTQYGDRTVADVRLAIDGSEAPLWRPGNDPVLLSYSRGQIIQVARDHKGKLSFVEQSSPHLPPPEPQAFSPFGDANKREVMEYIESMARLYRFCYANAEEQLKEHSPGCPDAAIQAGASSLFIAAQRRFDLA